jgi:predicted flap endonuclease-1-like 5' DNA nuclease
MNFWTGLILGLIIGWVIEWIIDWQFWRRRREEEKMGLRAEIHASRLEANKLRNELNVVQREAENWRAKFNDLVQDSQARVNALESANAELQGRLEARAAGASPTGVDTIPSLTEATPATGAAESVAVLEEQSEDAVVVSCPQDLSAVPGIGAVYERKLYSHGVGSYWALSELSDEVMADILGVKSFQNVNYDAIRASAREWAEKTDSIGRVWDGTEPDDFEILEGIGDVYESRLYEAGICTYEALAGTSEERLAEICRAPAARRPNYALWIETSRAKIAQRRE